MSNKRSSISKTYIELIGYNCQHPDCKSGLNIEVHHIIPLSKGGANEYWNLITLCFKCHRLSNLHRDWQDKALDLFTYKSYFELDKVGFVLDERNKEHGSVNNMLHNARASLSEQKKRKACVPDKVLVKTIKKEAESVTERSLAKKYNVTHGDINRIKKGITPKTDEKRKILNLPRNVFVQICHKCNQAHSPELHCKILKVKKSVCNPVFDSFTFIFKNIVLSYDKKSFIESARRLSSVEKKMVLKNYQEFYNSITKHI